MKYGTILWSRRRRHSITQPLRLPTPPERCSIGMMDLRGTGERNNPILSSIIDTEANWEKCLHGFRQTDTARRYRTRRFAPAQR
jgi:hypothetical protein